MGSKPTSPLPLTTVRALAEGGEERRARGYEATFKLQPEPHITGKRMVKGCLEYKIEKGYSDAPEALENISGASCWASRAELIVSIIFINCYMKTLINT